VIRSLKRFDGVALHKRMLDLDRERIAAWDVVATLSGLHGAFAAIATAREPEAVVAHTLAAAAEVLGFERAAYFTHAGARRECSGSLNLLAYIDESGEAPPELACSRAICTLDAPLDGNAGELSAPLVDARDRYVVAPIVCAKGRLGLLYLDGVRSGVPFAATLRLIGDLCAVSAAALQNGIAFQRTRSLASRDPLTGLLNRRAFCERLERELAAAQRYERQCACVMLDLDDLKRINDSGGHAVGDVVLKHLAATLTANARPSDLVARLGGDEFALAFMDVDPPLARALVRRLSGSLAAAGLRCSLGAALSNAAPSDAEAMLRKADGALYAVKAAGKNGYAFAE
jgi:diguanylate cyclase (GGDEF)-like protein